MEVINIDSDVEVNQMEKEKENEMEASKEKRGEILLNMIGEIMKSVDRQGKISIS